MHLRHIHFPTNLPVLYTHALHIQELFARQHLNHKAHLSASRQGFLPSKPSSIPSLPPPPNPKLLTFTTQPVYTTGIRESRSLTPSQIATLTSTGATHHASPRGGLTTYHGLGQLTAFLITSLSAHGLSPRCYVHFLEDVVIATSAVYGVKAGRWSSSSATACSGASAAKDVEGGEVDESRPGVWTGRSEKLCSVGIHFRRGVSSFGLGFNVTDEVKPWFERIVACGIPDSRAVSLMGEQERMGGKKGKMVDGVDGVASTLAAAIAHGLEGVDGVESVDPRALGDMDET